jgi:hypothetical protein
MASSRVSTFRSREARGVGRPEGPLYPSPGQRPGSGVSTFWCREAHGIGNPKGPKGRSNTAQANGPGSSRVILGIEALKGPTIGDITDGRAPA